MAEEMLNLQPIEPESKIELPEKTFSELEGKNFSHYVKTILRKENEQALADLIEQGKISLGLEARKAVITGNSAETSNPDDFSVVDHMNKRAQMVAENLIKNKKEYLHRPENNI